MSIIIDLVIVGIIAFCIIAGYIKGLTGSLIKILSFALSLVISFILFVPISNFIIDNTQIDESIENTIKETMLSNNNTNEKKENMPLAITDYINKTVEQAADDAKENVVNTTAKDVSQTIVKIGTWILLFFIARIALIFLKFITGLVSKLPVIKQFDKIGGVIYGLLEGVIITYFILALISVVTPVTDGTLTKNINKSYIGNTMYNNNLLLNIIF